jgi:hypothetical protein
MRRGEAVRCAGVSDAAGCVSGPAGSLVGPLDEAFLGWRVITYLRRPFLGAAGRYVMTLHHDVVAGT